MITSHFSYRSFRSRISLMLSYFTYLIVHPLSVLRLTISLSPFFPLFSDSHNLLIFHVFRTSLITFIFHINHTISASLTHAVFTNNINGKDYFVLMKYLYIHEHKFRLQYNHSASALN